MKSKKEAGGENNDNNTQKIAKTSPKPRTLQQGF